MIIRNFISRNILNVFNGSSKLLECTKKNTDQQPIKDLHTRISQLTQDNTQLKNENEICTTNLQEQKDINMDLVKQLEQLNTKINSFTTRPSVANKEENSILMEENNELNEARKFMELMYENINSNTLCELDYDQSLQNDIKTCIDEINKLHNSLYLLDKDGNFQYSIEETNVKESTSCLILFNFNNMTVGEKNNSYRGGIKANEAYQPLTIFSPDQDVEEYIKTLHAMSYTILEQIKAIYTNINGDKILANDMCDNLDTIAKFVNYLNCIYQNIVDTTKTQYTFLGKTSARNISTELTEKLSTFGNLIKDIQELIKNKELWIKIHKTINMVTTTRERFTENDKQIQELENNILILKSQYNACKCAFDAQIKSSKEKELELVNVKKELETLKTINENLTDQLNLQLICIEEQGKETQRLTQELKQTQSQHDKQIQELENKHKNEIIAKDQQIAQLNKQDIEKSRKQNQALESKHIEELEDTNKTTLENILKTTQKELDDIKNVYQDALKILEEAQNEIKKLKDQHKDEIKKLDNKHTNEIQELENKYKDELKTKDDQHFNAIKELENKHKNEIIAKDQELEQKEQALSDANTEKGTNQGQIAQLKEQITTLQKPGTSTDQQEVTKLKQEINGLKEQLKKLQEQLETAKTDLTDANTEKGTNQGQIAQLKEQITTLQKQGTPTHQQEVTKLKQEIEKPKNDKNSKLYNTVINLVYVLVGAIGATTYFRYSNNKPIKTQQATHNNDVDNQEDTSASAA